MSSPWLVLDAALGDPATATSSRDFFPQQKREKSACIESNRLRKALFDRDRRPHPISDFLRPSLPLGIPQCAALKNRKMTLFFLTEFFIISVYNGLSNKLIRQWSFFAKNLIRNSVSI